VLPLSADDQVVSLRANTVSTQFASPSSSRSGIQELEGPSNIYEPRNVEQSMWIAKTIAESGMAPAGMDTPQKLIVAMMHGASLGLSALQSVQNIHVIKGKPTLSADLMGAITRNSRSCLYLRETVATPERVTMTTARTDDPDHEFARTWTIDDAKRAGLANSSTWRSYPRQMLRARCLSEICRAVYPEVVGGFYVPHELDASRVPEPRIAARPAPAAQAAEVVVEVVETKKSAPAPNRALVEAKSAQADLVAAHELTLQRIQRTRETAVPIYQQAHPMLGELLDALCDLVELDTSNTDHLARFKLLDRLKPLETENGKKLTEKEWLALLDVPTVDGARSTGAHLRAASAYARLVLESWAWRYECPQPFDVVSSTLSATPGEKLIDCVVDVTDLPGHHWRPRFVELVGELLATDAEPMSPQALEVYNRAVKTTEMTDKGRETLRAALSKVPVDLMPVAERMATTHHVGLLLGSDDPEKTVQAMAAKYRDEKSRASEDKRRQRST